MDDANIDIGETGKFGAVKSGNLTLTGHLGVFRIEKEDQQHSHRGNIQLSPEELRVLIFWDTKEIQTRVTSCQKAPANGGTWIKRYSAFHYNDEAYNSTLGVSDIFYMPFRVMDADYFGFDYEDPVLTGMLLLPVDGRDGFYQRIGQYEIPERWLEKGESLEPMTRSTEIMDKRYFLKKHKHDRYTICVV